MYTQLLGLLVFGCHASDKGSSSVDEDGDGYTVDEDCDDHDSNVSPEATEACDGLDNDCDAAVDEGVSATFWVDADADGYGAVDGASASACTAPSGYAASADDCDDNDPAAHPGAAEACNGQDDDCDGQADEGLAVTTWYADLDLDGAGDDTDTVDDCVGPDGWIAEGGDCDDGDALVHPGAVEACNDTDDDCDGLTDEDFDVDGDGALSDACADGDDCDDSDNSAHPGAADTCGDGVDSDCDGADLACGFGGAYDLGAADAILYSSSNNFDAGRLVDIGDINGDGVGDVVIATLYADSYAGGAYVAYGPFSGATDLDATAVHLKGDISSTFGSGRSIGAGDADGDGYEDVLVGAPWASPPETLVIFGPISASMRLEDAPVSLIGPDSSLAGHGGDLADVTGDGIADAIVGAWATADGGASSGNVYVVNGPLSAGSVNLSADADAKLIGESADDYTGRFIRAGGDVNGDGVGDILAPAVYDSTGASLSGSVFVVYGPAKGDVDLGLADGWLVGDAASDYAGISVAMGDVDGDGRADVLVGSYGRGGGGDYGAAHLVLGPASGARDLGAADAIVWGTSKTKMGGGALAVSDIDLDGHAEVLVGAASDDTVGEDAGAAYLFFGPIAGAYTTGDAAASFMGESRGDAAGQGLALGDVDGDGRGEVLVGAPADSWGARAAGAVYVQYQD